MLATATVIEWATLVGAVGAAVSAIIGALRSGASSRKADQAREIAEAVHTNQGILKQLAEDSNRKATEIERKVNGG